MPTLPAPSAILIIGTITVAVAATVYAFVIRNLRRDGGRVAVPWVGLQDALVAILLASFFGGLVLKNALAADAPAEMSVKQVLSSALLFTSFVFALGMFLFFRRLPFGEVFGFTRLSAPRTIGWGVLLILCAFPLVFLSGWIMQQFMHGDASEQELVELFRAAAARGDWRMMLSVGVAGVIVAPICEEILFRGYFYPVGKRYAGPLISSAITSLVFALFHGNLSSLPSLLILAVALALAYERTGSLAVPITMHALFNGTSLTILYLQAAGRLPV
jgi:membrane protease YdiL (CAAX protease family)